MRTFCAGAATALLFLATVNFSASSAFAASEPTMNVATAERVEEPGVWWLVPAGIAGLAYLALLRRLRTGQIRPAVKVGSE